MLAVTPGSTLGDRVLLSGFDADNPNQIRGSGPELSSPEDLLVEADGRMLVLDDETAIVAVDAQSGDRSILSGENAVGDLIGAGPAFNGIQSLALDAANNRLFAVQYNALLAVDLDTGDRTLISAGAGEDPATDIGSGPALTDPLSLALDADNNRLLLLNGSYYPGSGKLMSVDLATGNRSVIADPDTGAGDMPQNPVTVSLDAANNRALVLDALSGKPGIVAVDLDTGNRSVISGYDLGPDGERNSGDEQLFGSGSPFNTEADLTDAVLDAGRRILYVTDNACGSLIAVDIDSGDRVLVSGFAF
nr:PQQ-binding-like beta-propeller repeat protein [Microbulbifer sp. GX H0434]